MQIEAKFRESTKFQVIIYLSWQYTVSATNATGGREKANVLYQPSIMPSPTIAGLENLKQKITRKNTNWQLWLKSDNVQ